MHEGMMERAHMCHGSMPEIWEMLTEEQKKEVALMKMDMKIQWLEMKINEMENMIKLKRTAIENIKKFQQTMKK
jgi:predicted 2-oxoglutarate/Fe(II)-dependent dioxygenase YbiX